MQSNLPQPVKQNLKRGEARIRREKIILKQSKPKLPLLKTRISTNHDTLALSVVMITTQKIVQDVPRSLSSFKVLQNHLHRLSCPYPSHINNRLRWSLFALFSSMCEKKVSAYMPSWALLVMTAVW
jgi:hypothetical protein